MTWFDPKNWSIEKDYGLNDISSLSSHFKIPLVAAGYDETKIIAEWKRFRCFIKAQYSLTELDDVTKIWKNVLLYKRDEFPNLCLLAELITSISGSNSSAERAFSILTCLLSDRRLKMKHQTIEDLLLIKCNNKIWDEKEKEEIIARATSIYLSKRRTTVVSEPAAKVARLSFQEESESDDELSESLSETHSESDIDDIHDLF